MTDRYEKIRKALAMGPTRGPWGATHGDAYLIAACDPDTIRALLEERDALQAENERLRKDAELYRWLLERLGDAPRATSIEQGGTNHEHRTGKSRVTALPVLWRSCVYSW